MDLIVIHLISDFPNCITYEESALSATGGSVFAIRWLRNDGTIITMSPREFNGLSEVGKGPTYG